MVLETNSKDPTVEKLQRKIEKQFGVPIDDQRIMFKGQNLQENRQGKLRSFGITNGSAIRVIGRKKPLEN